MIKSRLLKGSNLIEYIIPLAVIGLVVGLGLYSLSASGFIQSIFTASTYSEVDDEGKLVLQSSNITNNLKYDSMGRLIISDSLGNKAVIPIEFYEKNKKSIDKMIKKGKFDLSESAGTETSGTAGVENVSTEPNDSTYFYTKLLENVYKNTENKEARKMLKNLAKYGKKLGNIEKKLSNIQTKLTNLNTAYEEKKVTYEQAKESYNDTYPAYVAMATKCQQTKDTEICKQFKTVDKEQNAKYKLLQNTYKDYNGIIKKYENISNENAKPTQKYFADLSQITGISFDQVLSDIKTTDLIDDMTKEMVIPIGDQIKGIKDSIDLLDKQIATVTSSFNPIDLGFTELSDAFNSYHITVKDKDGEETDKLANEIDKKK